MTRTREEHIENLSAIMDSMPDDSCGDWRESIAYAIKALEQEPILDKIKAEIRNEQNMDYKCHRKTYDNCLRIIDKYTAESEG